MNSSSFHLFDQKTYKSLRAAYSQSIGINLWKMMVNTQQYAQEYASSVSTFCLFHIFANRMKQIQDCNANVIDIDAKNKRATCLITIRNAESRIISNFKTTKSLIPVLRIGSLKLNTSA